MSRKAIRSSIWSSERASGNPYGIVPAHSPMARNDDGSMIDCLRYSTADRPSTRSPAAADIPTSGGAQWSSSASSEWHVEHAVLVGAPATFLFSLKRASPTAMSPTAAAAASCSADTDEVVVIASVVVVVGSVVVVASDVVLADGVAVGAQAVVEQG